MLPSRLRSRHQDLFGNVDDLLAVLDLLALEPLQLILNLAPPTLAPQGVGPHVYLVREACG